MKWNLDDGFSPVHLSSAAWNGETYVIVGAEGVVLVSNDSISWSRIETFTQQRLKDIIWDGNRFIALGINGEIFAAEDINNWKMISKISFEDEYEYAQKLIFTGKHYIVVGSDRYIHTSLNAIDWTKNDLGNEYGFESIVWNGKLYVAVGMFGAVYTSSDGANWTQQNSNTMNNFTSIVWNGNKFFAVGDWYLIAQSPDGINWTATAKNQQYLLSDIIWDGTKFIVMHAWGDILTSKDAINWDVGKFSASMGEFKALWTGEKIIVVGEYGSISTSLNPGVIKVKVNNKPIVFDKAPEIIQNRTMVPMRAIFESLDADIVWDEKSKTVTGTKGKSTAQIKINDMNAVVNGKIIELDTPAIIRDGRTLVPLRFISEALGAKVDWDQNNSMVTVSLE